MSYQLPKPLSLTVSPPPDIYDQCPRRLQGKAAHDRLGLMHVVMPGTLYCCLVELEQSVKDEHDRQQRRVWEDDE